MEIIKPKETFYHPFGEPKFEIQNPNNLSLVDLAKKYFPNLSIKAALQKMFTDVFEFEKDKIYIVARDLRDSLPFNTYENVKVSKFPKMYTGFEDLNNKSLVVFNLHAYGDSLIATPIYKYIKTKYPKSKLIVEIKRNYNILKHCPYIDDFVYTPVEYDKKIKEADYFIDFYEYVNSYAYNNLNLVDFWAMQLRLKLDDKLPVLNPPANKLIEKWNKLLSDIRNEAKKPIMLLHGLASSLHRNIPMAKLIEIMKEFENEYAFITIYPKNKQQEISQFSAELLQFDYYYNLSDYSESIDDLLAAIYNLTNDDRIISADTVVPHVAAAYRKYCYVIAGGIAPEAQHYYKSSYEPYVRIIYPSMFIGQACKGNCLIHAHAGPCPEAQATNQIYSPCITTMHPKYIKKTIENFEKVKKVNCISCGKELEWYKVDDKGALYYCYDCGIKFRDNVVIPEPMVAGNLQLPNTKHPELHITVNVKLATQYVALLPYIRNANSIAIIQEFPGLLYKTVKNIQPNTKLYEIHQQIQYLPDIARDVNYINDYDDILDTFDIVVADLPVFAFAKKKPDEIIQQLLEKLNDNGVLILTYINANRYNTFMQKNIDISKFFSKGVDNYEVSFDYIKQVVKNIDANYNIVNTSALHQQDYLLTIGNITPPLVLTEKGPQIYQPPQNVDMHYIMYGKQILDYISEHIINTVVITKQNIDYDWYSKMAFLVEKLMHDFNRYIYDESQLFEKSTLSSLIKGVN